MSVWDLFKGSSLRSAYNPVDGSGLQILDHPLVLSLVFYPRRDHGPVSQDPGVQEHLFEVEDGVSIGCRFYVRGLQAPVLVYFHGNGEIAADYDDLAPLYTERGINLLVVDYRGYGRSTGTPTISSMIRDARYVFNAAREMLAQRGFTGDLWVMGRSLGSGSALEVARGSVPCLKGLIIESGFADVMGLLARIGIPVHRLSVPKEVSQFNISAIREVELPTLIIHGEWDQIIPVSEGEALYAASGATKKELLIIPRAGHNDLFWVGMESYMDAVCRFLFGGV
ncbi:MAG: alpha/beta hydrolase [Thermodesulfobacteriota bacterium]